MTTTQPKERTGRQGRGKGKKSGEQTPRQREEIKKMITMAQEHGCQLQPTPNSPHRLRGMCPFHENNAEQNGSPSVERSLELNINTQRFRCIRCQAQGGPHVFAARTWGVSVRDARQLLEENPDASLERPPYAEAHFQAEAQSKTQNTALLTRAARFYGAQIQYSYPALRYLAMLGIHPDKAAQAGIGYCTGKGLREYLLGIDVQESELSESPLFNELSGIETMTGRVTISDLDNAAATVWMTSVQPEDRTTPRYSMPRTFGLPGRKPYLFNSSHIRPGQHDTILTDDVRLYMMLVVNGMPAMLFTQRQDSPQGISYQAKRILEVAQRNNIQRLSLPMHNKHLREQIVATAREEAPGTRVFSREKRSIMASLQDNPKNLTRFLEEPVRNGAGE